MPRTNQNFRVCRPLPECVFCLLLTQQVSLRARSLLNDPNHPPPPPPPPPHAYFLTLFSTPPPTSTISCLSSDRTGFLAILNHQSSYRPCISSILTRNAVAAVMAWAWHGVEARHGVAWRSAAWPGMASSSLCCRLKPKPHRPSLCHP